MQLSDDWTTSFPLSPQEQALKSLQVVDRQLRSDLLDAHKFQEFERQFGVTLRTCVVQLWLDAVLHLRFKQKGRLWGIKRSMFVTGSRVGSILGFNPYPDSSRFHVFKDYALGESTFTGNVATEHGEAYEDAAVRALELTLTRESHATVFLPFDMLVSHYEQDRYAYSPDGISNTGELAEVKAPFRRAVVPSDLESIPSHYKEGQVQYGMHCLRQMPVDVTRYAEFIPPYYRFNQYAPKSTLSVTTFTRDDTWAGRYTWLLDEFWGEVTQYREDSKLPAHYESAAAFKCWWSERLQAEPDKFPPTLRVTKKRKAKTASTASTASTAKSSKIIDATQLLLF